VQILGMSQQSLTQGIQVLLVLVFTYHPQQSQHHHRLGNDFRFFYFCDLPDILMMHDLHECSVTCKL
jgi:hypothetical protein